MSDVANEVLVTLAEALAHEPARVQALLPMAKSKETDAIIAFFEYLTKNVLQSR